MPDPKDSKPYAGERFQANPYPFAYTMVRDTQTGELVYKRTVSPRVPDRILKTGNRKELENFYVHNYANLTAADKRYLQARLHTAALVERLEEKALRNLADGKAPTQPTLTTKKGYCGFDKLKLPGPQTSGNGCWSCAMSLLLKSRGVDMTQEEIRAFKPDYEPGRENMSEDKLYSSNMDDFNSPYENADLIMKVLPNSALRNISLNPVDETLVLSGDFELPKPPENLSESEKNVWLANKYESMTGERQKRAAALYKEDVKKLFVEKVRQGLFVDKSPVIMNRGGAHYVTITGMTEDGKKLRIEDSSRIDGGTKYVKVDELIDKYLAPGMHGLDLTWVQDLPVPEKNKAPEKTALLADMADFASMDKNGDVTLKEPQKKQKEEAEVNREEGAEANREEEAEDEPEEYISAQRDAKEGIGQLKGQELTKLHYMDQTQLQQELGGQLEGYGTSKKGKPLQMTATECVYLPRKTRLPGDPSITEELERKKAEEQREEASEQQELRDSVKEMFKPGYLPVMKDDVREEPAAGTFDAFEANQKNLLYQQGPDTAVYIAELYAMNVVRTSPEKQAADKRSDDKAAAALSLADELEKLKDGDPQAGEKRREKHKQLTELYPHLGDHLDKESGLLRLTPPQLREQIKAGNRTEKQLITAHQRKLIEEMSKLALPVVKDMMGPKEESTRLPLAAVEEDQRKLVNRIDSFAQKRYYMEPNPGNDPGKPDWVEKKQTFDSALAVLRATGTGKNYFGKVRARNSDKYEQMLAAAGRYQELLQNGKTHSGMQNRQLAQHLLNYIGDKMSVRSTKDTGQVRFDSVMRMLQQVMPPKQFKKLLTQINQKREVRRGDKNYVDENTYAPKTAKLYAQMKAQQALNKSGADFVRLCSESLAAKLLGMEHPRGDKTLVEDPADPGLQQALEQKAAQLRQEPAFRKALAMIPAGRTEQETRQNRRDWLAGGEGLANLYAMNKEPQEQLQMQQ